MFPFNTGASVVVLWVVTCCSLVNGYQCCGGTYWLHLQGRRLKKLCQNLKVYKQHGGGVLMKMDDLL